ncbi:hypothetical protein Tco_0085649 [Tanacetum coccineum]
MPLFSMSSQITPINDGINVTLFDVITLQAPVHKLFEELSEFDMKEILHEQMFESGSYRSQPEHVALYEALEASMDRENRGEFLEAIANTHDVHLLDSEDIGADHLPKIKTRPDWLKPILEEKTSETPEPDWVIPPNDLHEPENNWANAIAKSYQDPEENKLLVQIL